MSKLISAAQPVRSAQELLDRLKQMKSTAMVRPAQGPQSKRMKGDSKFPVAATAGPTCFLTAGLMESYCTQDALEGFHEDKAPIRADDPVGPVVTSSGTHPGFALQQPPLHQSVEGQMALTKVPGELCIGNSAPEPMLAFTQGNVHAFKLPLATWCLVLMHGVMHGVTVRWSVGPSLMFLCGFLIAPVWCTSWHQKLKVSHTMSTCR